MTFSALTLTLSFLYCAQTPAVRPRAHRALHSHYIVYYSEEYVRLKINVFSPRRKADVDCVLFSSVGSWFNVRSRCSSGKCSIRRFPVRPWHDIVSATVIPQ